MRLAGKVRASSSGSTTPSPPRSASRRAQRRATGARSCVRARGSLGSPTARSAVAAPLTFIGCLVANRAQNRPASIRFVIFSGSHSGSYKEKPARSISRLKRSTEHLGSLCFMLRTVRWGRRPSARPGTDKSKTCVKSSCDISMRRWPHEAADELKSDSRFLRVRAKEMHGGPK
jgi:hypothetical protein